MRSRHFATENNRKRKDDKIKATELKLHRKVVSAKEWQAARQQLLAKEKELTRARDALAAERRRMPWVAVEKEYEFNTPQGKVSLLDLFDGRRQLIIYRAFFEAGVVGWPEHACVGCSMVADQVAHPAHLKARDTTLVFASRAPQRDIERLKARMGWEFIPWYTITDDFDKDFGVDEWHGTNAFIRDGNRVFRTYFINNRGDEQMGERGTISTSQRSDGKRNGKTRPKVILRQHRMSGGIGTTSTETTKLRPEFSNRSAGAALADKQAVTCDHSPRGRADGSNKNDNAGLPT